MRRSETRRQRYEEKAKTAQTIPVSVCMINFGIDDNVALTIRAAACYGAESVMIIGSVPDRSFLRPRSGTTVDYVEIKQFSTPHDFLEFCRKEEYDIVSAELCDGATDLFNHRFSFDRKTVIVMGNEYTGVPAEIIHNSRPVYIRMAGTAYSLNVMQASTAFLNEYSRQHINYHRSF